MPTNNKLIHDTIGIKSDNDIAQMINLWKKVQRIDSFVYRPHTWKYIELFVQTTYIRSPTGDELWEYVKP